MSFDDLYNTRGFIQKTALGPLSYSPNKQTDVRKRFDLHPQHQKTLEDTRRRPFEGGAHLALSQVSQPTPRSADPGGSHLSASFASRFPTAIEVQSMSLLKLI
jgi:hypothetical protein